MCPVKKKVQLKENAAVNVNSLTSLISSLKTEGTFTAISFTPKNSLLTKGETHIHQTNVNHIHARKMSYTTADH